MLNAEDIAEALRKEGDAEVSGRTVHFYRREGILPPAYGRGDGAFGPEHLALMREARRLRRQGMPLDEVRSRLAERSSSDDRLPSRHRAMLAVPAAAATRQATVDEAMRVRGPRLPRSLRLRGGFVLQVPPGADDDLVARLYAAIDSTLAAEETASRKKPARERRAR